MALALSNPGEREPISLIHAYLARFPWVSEEDIPGLRMRLEHTTDIRELEELRGESHPFSLPRKLIEERIANVLPALLQEIADFGELYRLWRELRPGACARPFIEDRMAELISQEEDFKQLRAMRVRVKRSPVLRRLVEAKIGEAVAVCLPTITDFDELCRLWDVSAHGTAGRGRVEQRMAEVLQDVTDFKILRALWDKVRRGTGLQKLVEQRIALLLGGISAGDIPSWFLRLLQHPESFPKTMRPAVTETALRLAAELEGRPSERGERGPPDPS